MSACYDTIGHRYTATRRTDPRIAAAIWEALGDAESVLDVGSGAGAYEPPGREVVAVEPSEVMITQRPPDAAPVIRARAERLPLPDDSFDAAMAVLSDHHWSERGKALRELRRVARARVVIFNVDPAEHERFWLTRDYLPGLLDLVPAPYRVPGHWRRELAELLGDVELREVPVPWDCVDGFYSAFWRRPAAYLEEGVRASISVFARLPAPEVEAAVSRLHADLETGGWEAEHADLLDLDELDLGYRIVVAA